MTRGTFCEETHWTDDAFVVSPNYKVEICVKGGAFELATVHIFVLVV